MCKEYINLQTCEKLDLNILDGLKDNSMLKNYPEMWINWDFSKNENEDIFKVGYGSGKKVYWYCDKCKQSIAQFIKNKTTKNIKCPCCSGKIAYEGNNLLLTHPDLCKQWNYEKNELSPTEVTFGSDKIVWWIGECGHEWENRIQYRTCGKGIHCPYCINKRIDSNINTLNITHPEILEILENKEDAESVTKGSYKKLKFICYCGNRINKEVHLVASRGLSCKVCSDYISFGEKMMYNLLKSNNIEFNHDSKLYKTHNYRYDFYLPEHNMIVEIHGGQHFKDRKDNFHKNNTRTLSDEINNDTVKRELAINNGVRYYFELLISNQNVDEFEFEVINSGLKDILNLDLSEYKSKFHKSKVIDVCEYYNDNNDISAIDIMCEFKISRYTLNRYLRLGNDIGLCEYLPGNNKFTEKQRITLRKNKGKIVLKTDLYGNVLDEYCSIREARIKNNIGGLSIRKCISGEKESHLGYKWKLK